MHKLSLVVDEDVLQVAVSEPQYMTDHGRGGSASGVIESRAEPYAREFVAFREEMPHHRRKTGTIFEEQVRQCLVSLLRTTALLIATLTAFLQGACDIRSKAWVFRSISETKDGEMRHPFYEGHRCKSGHTVYERL